MVEEKIFPSDESVKLPKPFILRRLHSLLGAWLVLYLFLHLLVNSQAAFFFHDEGSKFIDMVNRLESVPFLPLVELLVIALPFFIHIVWGVIYLRTSKINSIPSDGTKPDLKKYRRNRAYSWQRVTSWILIVLVIAHVVHMRFLRAPLEVGEGQYRVRVSRDGKLDSVVEKLKSSLVEEKGQLYALSDSPGKGFYFMVRESFKSPIMVSLYSAFVIFSCYHAFNGLWTFLITWGVTLTRRIQRDIKIVTVTLMWATIILGLLAAWGTYFNYVYL